MKKEWDWENHDYPEPPSRVARYMVERYGLKGAFDRAVRARQQHPATDKAYDYWDSIMAEIGKLGYEENPSFSKIPLDLMNAFNAVLLWWRKKPNAYSDTAASYIRPIVEGKISSQDAHAMYTQLLYVKSNLRYWRGEKAKEAKAVIDKYIEIYKKGGTNGNGQYGDNPIRWTLPFAHRAAVDPYSRGSVDTANMVIRRFSKTGRPMRMAVNSSTKGAYPFGEKQEQYSRYTMKELLFAQKDAYEAAQAMKGGDPKAEAWYWDDFYTITDEINRRRSEPLKRRPIRRKGEFLNNNPEYLPGGHAEGMDPDDFDPHELAEGTMHEMEHTTDPRVAQEIALDHLAHDPAYYIKLKKAGL